MIAPVRQFSLTTDRFPARPCAQQMYVTNQKIGTQRAETGFLVSVVTNLK
jgi:hypothetical protein